MTTKVTIEDISRHTGLSRGTVSRALNDRPDISEATKQRVLEACRTLNYVPSYAARSLATGRTFAVTVLIPEVGSPFVTAFLRGVVSRAQKSQYLVSIIEIGNDSGEVRTRLQMLSGERIDGLVVAAPIGEDIIARVKETMGERPIASILPLEGLVSDVFAPDFAEAGRLLAQHLIDAAGNDVVLVRDPRLSGIDALTAGFVELVSQRNSRPGGEIAIDVANPGQIAGLVRGALSGARGVAVSDDMLATGLAIAMERSGRRIGADVAIAAVGDSGAASWLEPALTTVDPVAGEIGERALDSILQRLAKTRYDTPQVTEVPPKLIVRESSRLA